MNTLHVIVTVYDRPIHLRRLIDCFLLQTCPSWKLYVVCDGPPMSEILATMALYDDPRITFTSTPQVNGKWGHPNRKLMLEQLEPSSTDFVVITNDDNVYVTKFVEYFLASYNPKVGFIFCDTIHSYLDYNVMKTVLMVDHIDMGCFAVRLDVARTIGFTHEHFSADGTYAVECATYCLRKDLRRVYIPKPLFTHS